MKKIVVNSVILALTLAFVSCTGEDVRTQEPEVLILEDLSELFTPQEGDLASRGDCPLGLGSVSAFPVNGCATFTIRQTVKYVFGETTIETRVTVCCACAVCFPMRLDKQVPLSDPQKGKVLGVRIEDSSSITFENYEISIAEGEYAVDENGNLKKIKYQVIVN
jgi:hypothetical protein